MNILITGGAGYIGAHVVKLLRDESDSRIHVIDNFSQSRRNILKSDRITYHEVDIRDKESLDKVFSASKPDVVFHFAALASVPDSVINPLSYYDNNVIGTLNLLECMKSYGTRKIIFSSSAAVYGEPESEEITEDHPKRPTNPYGKTKLIGEEILKDYFHAYGISSVSFRYFCAAGIDPEKEVGEYHNPQTHVIPSILETIAGKREGFSIFGDNFPTSDGTGVRDYIHVMDLARAHILAIHKLTEADICVQYNLGINKGFSVMELIKASEKVTGMSLPYTVKERRPGDPAKLIANSDKAQKELNWQPEYTDIEKIIETTYSSIQKI